jgi:hypothetical protein
MPSRKSTPRTTFGKWFSPFNHIRTFAAAITSLNTIGLAVNDDNEPVVRIVLCRAVANRFSTGFVVRK